jgi:hypothetical protein
VLVVRMGQGVKLGETCVVVVAQIGRDVHPGEEYGEGRTAIHGDTIHRSKDARDVDSGKRD